jgi:hypothetical protein
LLFYPDQQFQLLVKATRRQMTGNLRQCFQEYMNSFKDMGSPS